MISNFKGRIHTMHRQICCQIIMDPTISPAISPTLITIIIVHMIILEQHIRHLLEQLCDPLSQRANPTTPHSHSQDHVSILFVIQTGWLLSYRMNTFISGAPNGTSSISGGNATHPPHNYNNNPHGHNPNQNPNHYDPSRAPNSGNFGQNYDNNRGGSTTYRPFPSKCADRSIKR